MRHVEAPREEPDQRGARGGRDRGRVVGPDQRDADRALVEPLRVRTDDVAVDAAPPAFEDLAVLVDEEVVTDVVPAVREHVVALDATDDRGGLRSAVRVRADRVMDDGEAQRVRVRRLLLAADLLVRAPAGAGDDQRRARLRDRPQPDLPRRAPDVVRTDTGDAAERAHLDPVRRPGPERASELPAPGPQLVGSRVGPVVLGRRVAPAGPASGHGPRPERDGPAAFPVQADEVEPVGGSIDARPEVVRGERRAGCERGARRHDQQKKD